MSSEPSNSPDDTFKILVATDIHLGFDYNKKAGHVSEDSFTTFEEILQYARDYEVDFILLGGDLFHDTKPSQIAILKCMELLRKYCLGPREIKVQFLSDPEVVFRHCTYKTVNYEDPNINVSIPVFSIHGNHDDPSFGAVGSMDLLSVSGLINYFGKWTDLTQVSISPLILKKGETHVALYGLSYINDQRLSRLLRDFKVDMLRPKDIPDCFNIFVLHQNRAQHGEYAYIPQNKLPNFLNLIIWGHEHECRITPEFITDAEYFISQPGSSIATSLCEAEAKPKHVGLLSVNGMKFKMKKLKLKTVRPFVFDNLVLQEQEIPKDDFSASPSTAVYNFVDKYIEDKLIPQAAEQLTGHPKQPIQPLLRLRIFHTKEEELFDTMKLAQKYCEEVANPMEMVVFRKEKSLYRKPGTTISRFDDDLEEMAQALHYNDDDIDWNRTVQGGIKKFFTSEENKDKLTVLTVNGLNEALNRFVDRGDNESFKDIVSHQMKKTIAFLETCDNVDNDASIIQEIKDFRDRRIEEEHEEEVELQELFNSTSRRTAQEIESLADIDNLNVSDEDEQRKTVQKTTRGKGTTSRGRGSRGGGRGRAKKDSENDSSDIATVSRPKTARQTKKQVQSTLQDLMGTSLSRNKDKVFIIDDSD
ncbi:double strand break repair nuclease mre11 [Calliopsis andreniformis]|uniref:double strand break repair nuclease mre11 n=1 Tax=Calliopsis andreniformis TaxID=337506 RepID=UPI003FCE71F2